MRKYAFVDPKDEVKKVMIYEVEPDIYVFIYETLEDVPCTKDYWFETLMEAEEYCGLEDWNGYRLKIQDRENLKI
ncbi:hypothetical protein [Saccharibacillus sacchari]|uniref:hypothetical protein n=1 Tax=Saccharibacillus sacchari TaxID=456493 RepID=UPI00055AB518|nr:hypothetical protein [Saccharibacillus sacchari]